MVDISVEAIMAMKQQQFQTELTTRINRKVMDIAEQQGQQLVAMIESTPVAQSPTDRSGLNIDVKA